MRLIEYFDRGASLSPERTCLFFQGEGKTYREIQARSHLIANALIADGLAPQDKAAVLSPNGLAAFECVLGILRADGVWTGANERARGSENAYLLDLLDVTVLFYHSAVADRITAFRRQCPKIRRYVCIDAEGGGDVYLERWVEGHEGVAPERSLGLPDELATLSNTGGTTGKPKGVMWSNLNWETLLSNFHLANPMRTPPVHLVAAPITHAAGTLAVLMMVIGGTNVVLPRFDAEEVMRAIQEHRITYLFLPPTAIYMMLAHPRVREYDYSSLQYFAYAAAPMSVAKLREALDVFGPVMTSGYGQVEAPATCTVFPPWEHFDPVSGREAHLGSCGRSAMLTRLEIMDDDGRLLASGERGEIVVRGNIVTPGYYKNPDATAEVRALGWHHTGDIGYKDEEGYVYIVDRKKDMIITGGFNVYSSEVEQAVMTHPAVQDCAVVGVPDEKWGEAVKAVVELKKGESVAVEEIISFVKERLGSVKTPKSVEFWPSLPRSTPGKILKREIRERFWAGHERRI